MRRGSKGACAFSLLLELLSVELVRAGMFFLQALFGFTL